MFSVTGNWKKDLFDGDNIEIDLQTQKIKNLLCDNLSIVGTFNAFYRGFGL